MSLFTFFVIASFTLSLPPSLLLSLTHTSPMGLCLFFVLTRSPDRLFSVSVAYALSRLYNRQSSAEVRMKLQSDSTRDTNLLLLLLYHSRLYPSLYQLSVCAAPVLVVMLHNTHSWSRTYYDCIVACFDITFYSLALSLSVSSISPLFGWSRLSFLFFPFGASVCVRCFFFSHFLEPLCSFGLFFDRVRYYHSNITKICERQKNYVCYFVFLGSHFVFPQNACLLGRLVGIFGSIQAHAIHRIQCCAAQQTL